MTEPAPQNYLRFRISPEMTIAIAVSISAPDENGKRSLVELEACRFPHPGEMEAYERVLTDAMAGDATLFARQDYVEEAWRIVDPVLKANTPVYPYQIHTWGPSEDAAPESCKVVPSGGWQSPLNDTVQDLHVIPQLS
jgi:glucose-6-phosphate 1-dehydrogenase